MPTAILQTKLYTPPLRPDRVPRARLIDKLNAGRHRKLTLISAPAGFGKTTLVSEWVHGRSEIRDWRLDKPDAVKSPISNNQSTKAAWLSLDEGDNNPTRFLTYLVAALQTIVEEIGAGCWVCSTPRSRRQPIRF